MIRSIVEGVYEDYMKAKFKNYEQRQQDLEQLSNFSDRFTDPLEFLSQLALLSGVDTDNNPTSRPQDRDAVTLTTGHQAKGLEWGRLRRLARRRHVPPQTRHRRRRRHALEEERRLFYVTVTRAKDELYLTYPVINHQARDGDIMMRPSRFITDLPKDLVEVWNVKSGW
jgi:DNA helicase-2/ATP-dependent DNA helicase PcrA